MVGSSPLSVLVAPNDFAFFQDVNWQWPYTNPSELVVKQTLTSYVPNARVFGQFTPSASMSVWDVSWSNAGGGKLRMTGITDGTSNTLAVVEKQMVTGDAILYFKDWGTYGGTAPGFSDGVNIWGATDTQPEGVAFFGCNCDDPTQSWDNKDGQWWLGNCKFGGKFGGVEYFHPPVARPIPAQQNAFNIYPFNAGNVVLALLCDGSVRNITTSISVQAWSAAVTHNGGEIVPLDN
jgi:hypothetical protein